MSLKRTLSSISLLFFISGALYAQDCNKPQEAWNALGPVPILKRNTPYQGILVSCEHPSSDTSYQRFFVGSNSSGLFYTEDAGNYWENLTDNARLPGMGVQDIALHETDPGIILLATGMTTYNKDYGQGLVYTTDFGLNWNVVKEINPKSHTRKIARRVKILPGSYAALAGVEDELWFTEDLRKAGSWRMVWKAITGDKRNGDFYISEIKFHPEFPGIPDFYIACSDPGADQGGSKAFRVDLQDNFKVTPINPDGIKASPRIDVACSEAAPNRLYMILNRPGSNFDLHVSDDRGETWRLTRNLKAYGMGMAGFEMEVSPTDPELIYYGGISFFKQVGIDKGLPNRVQRNIHDDTRDFLILEGSEPGYQGDKDVLLNANDGGLSINMAGAKKNWNSLVGEGVFGLNISQFYGIALHPSDTNVLAGGLQDNGTILWDKTKDVRHLFGGDGGDCVYMPDGRMIANYNSGASPGKIFQFDGRKTDQYTKTSFGESNSPLEMIPANVNKLFYAHAQAGNPPIFDLVELNVSSGEIRNLSNKGNKAVKAIGLSPSDPQTLYYANLHVSYGGEPEGIVWRSNNGGESWTDISKALAGSRSMRVSDIAVHPDDGDIVMVSYGGNAPANKVFISTNGGNSWQDMSRGLTEFGINRLKISRHGMAFAASDDGVYVFDKVTQSWKCYSNGLPVVPISDIEFDYCNERVVISTFGRGLWETEYEFSELESVFPPLVIDSDTTISSDVFLGRDLVIAKKAKLIIKGEPSEPIDVQLLSGAKITLEKKAELILEHARISTPCAGSWSLQYDFGWLSKKVKAEVIENEGTELQKLKQTDFELRQRE